MIDIAKNAEPMEPDTVRREVSSDEAGAHTAQTAADALPYGTYDVRETAANGSYLLTDGEPRTFEVCAGGEVSKKTEADNAGLMAPFAIENAATGETHVLVTDRNGDASTANSWNRHSRDTSANDALLGHEDPIVADDMDPEAGIWFLLGENGSSAPVDDSLAVLPYGAYTMTELRCDANEASSSSPGDPHAHGLRLLRGRRRPRLGVADRNHNRIGPSTPCRYISARGLTYVR